jgi:hypothetical protein
MRMMMAKGKSLFIRLSLLSIYQMAEGFEEAVDRSGIVVVGKARPADPLRPAEVADDGGRIVVAVGDLDRGILPELLLRFRGA